MKYTLVTTESDWQGLYIGDEIFLQDHSVRLGDFACLVTQYPLTSFESVSADDDWFDITGHLPFKLEDVVLSDDGKD